MKRIAGMGVGQAMALASAAVGIAVGIGASNEAPAAAAVRPNVLVIVTDDQRDLDSTLAVMPKLKRWLVDAGKQYPNAMVTTPSCCPSRSTIFTGRYVHNHGVKGQNLDEKLDQSSTVQKHLRDSGYTTALVGKYLNGWPLTVAPPNFDRYSMVLGGYTNVDWNINGAIANYADYTTTKIGNDAVGYLNEFEARNDAQPWFMYLATLAPHKPMTPEAKYATAPVPAQITNPAINEDVSDKPPYIASKTALSAGTIRYYRDNQLRTLMSVDDMVDKVMTRLQVLGELDNTLVIFTSDNGVQWGEQRMTGKFVPYRSAIRVPLVMRWPGQVPAAVTSSRMAANVDIAPTIFHAAGLTRTTPPFDGRSLIGSAPGRSRMLIEYWFDSANGPASPPTWAGTVTKTYQYAETYATNGTVAFREYYDLVADPWMTTNLLADANPANDPAISPLAAQLAADRACSGTTSCP